MTIADVPVFRRANRNGRSTRRLTVAASAITGSVLLAGCGFGGGIYNVSLPGGASLGSHPIEVTAQFSDALDLVPQSGVKVNNVAVGRVTKISLEPSGKLADVTMKVNSDVHLPANAIATISQTSLLGEKYVSLSAPTDVAAAGTLANGARISDASTSEGVQLEQVFGALSLLLNGGGVGQLHDITTELNKAASGNETEIRAFLTSANQVVGQLNSRRSSITTALDGLDRLSHTLDGNNAKIASVLANFSPGLKVLSDQRTQLVGMLKALDQLSSVTVRTVQASQADLVGDLKQLQPILTQLAAAGSALPQSLQILLTYPFPDAALAGIKGDYLNTFITTNFRTKDGKVVDSASTWPSLSGTGTGTTPATTAGLSPAAIGPPPSLLPSTTSVVPGLDSSTIDTTAPASSTAAGSTPSGSPSGSASTSPTGSGTPSNSGSTSAAAPSSPARSSTAPTATGSKSGSTSASTTTTAPTSPAPTDKGGR